MEDPDRRNMKKILLIILLTLLASFSTVSAGYNDLNNLINNQRNYKLKSSYILDQIALCRAKYVAEGHWTHAGYQTCFNRYGIKWNYGEVLAKGYYSDGDIVNAWLNSPTHKNVMFMNWRNIGSSKWGDIIVVVFN